MPYWLIPQVLASSACPPAAAQPAQTRQPRPATRAHTYRQKAQRAFAAELLAPFEAVDAMLAGDADDEERRQAVANHFAVSSMAVDTLLMNHGRLQREDPERDFDAAAA